VPDGLIVPLLFEPFAWFCAGPAAGVLCGVAEGHADC
jgi:hypothetical protein